MLTIRWYLLILLSLSLAAEEPWALSGAERQAIAALAEQAIALGLPDTRGAKLTVGKLKLTRAGHDSVSIDGLHAQAIDGTWLVHGCLRIDPAHAVTVDATDVIHLTNAELIARARRQTITVDDQTTKPGAAILRQWAASSDGIALTLLNDHLGVASGFHRAWDQPGIAAATAVMLMRGGVPDAETCAVGVGRWAWMVNGDEHGRITPLNLGRFAPFELRDPPAPAEALRRGLIAWFRRQVAGPLPPPLLGIDPARAAAAAKTLLPAEATAERNEIDVLLTRSRSIRVDASLAERLAERLAGYLEPPILFSDHAVSADLVQKTQANWKAMTQAQRDAIPSERRSVVDWLLSQHYESVGVGDLIPLVADTRTARWLDHGHPRTIGDQALRMIADLVHVDPRAFTSRDSATPWTPAERTAVARELADWWRTNGERTPDTWVLDATAKLTTHEIIDLIPRWNTELREQLLDRLAVAWAAGPPAGTDLGTLGILLGQGRDHARFLACVDRWVPPAQLRSLLAVWRAGRGQPQELDALADAALTALAAGNTAEHLDLVFLRARHEDMIRLQQFLTSDAGLTHLMAVSKQLTYFHGPEINLVQRDNPIAAKCTLAMRLLLAAQLLTDHRPAPAALIADCEQHERWLAELDITPPRPRRILATDLRVADFSGQIVDALLRELAEGGFQGVRNGLIDPTSPIAVRDGALIELMNQVYEALPPLLAEVGWTVWIPGLKAPATVMEIFEVPF